MYFNYVNTYYYRCNRYYCGSRHYHQGWYAFNAAVAVLAAVAWYEYHKMVENKGYHAYTLTGGVGALLMVLVAGAGYYFELEGVYTLAFIVMLTALFFIFSTIEGLWLHCNRGEQHWAENSALTAWGMLYCGLCLRTLFCCAPLTAVRISIWASVYLSTAKSACGLCFWAPGQAIPLLISSAVPSARLRSAASARRNPLKALSAALSAAL